MKYHSVHEAKTNLSQLIKQACAGEEVVIARGKKPVVKLVPIGDAVRERRPGGFEGKFTYDDDVFAPLTDEQMKELRVRMNLLVDSHALLWWLDRPDRLSQRATRAIQDHKNQVIVSSVIAWELAIKVNAGRLDVKDLISEFETVMTEKGFLALAISTEHALRAGVLPPLPPGPI